MKIVNLEIPDDPMVDKIGGRPEAIFANSRYQVAIWTDTAPEPFGEYAHLSIKVHDKQAWHDWRDLQRIKNELCGVEVEAVEVYPAESRLVDTANQYHLYVFKRLKLPFGFTSRLVGDGQWGNSRQRPFEPGARPADCLGPDEFDRKFQQACGTIDSPHGEEEAAGDNAGHAGRDVHGDPGDRACRDES
jgi:hypothetical protein